MKGSRRSRSRIASYGVAVALVAAAAALQLALAPFLGDRFPLLMFFPAIMVTAWFGGFWPGIVSTVCSAIVAEYLWIDPVHSLRIARPGDAIALLMFVAIGVVISGLNELLRRGGLRQRQAQERIAELIASVPGVVWEAWGRPDASSQRIDFVSDYVETMLGYSVAEWLATPNFWLTIVHPDDRDAAAQVAREAFATRRRHVNRFRWLQKNGDAVWVESHAIVVGDADGAAVGMRGVTLDITERKQAEEALERVTAELRTSLADTERHKRDAEQANRTKDRFLATVSHELRATLTAILGWADMLRTGALPEERRARAIEAIHTNAQRQARLVDDLLDVARIVSGKLHLERSAVDVAAAIRSTLDGLRPAAEQKRVALVVDVDPAIGLLHADGGRLQQIVSNLASNAVKFTAPGGVVRVRARRDAETIEIVVMDDGEGIRPDFLPRVFEPFEQGDDGTGRSHGGLGLGLAIVKHLAEAHGGTVAVDSAGEGCGSAFSVRLPAAAVQTGRM
jgi:PAS domain S-box-containing protein